MAATEVQTKLKVGMAFLAKQEYDQAKNYFNDLLDEYPESAQCYYGLMMAELKANSFAQLEKVEIHIGDLTSFKRALRFSDPAFKARLETIQQKNEEYIRLKLEESKVLLNKPKQEADPVQKPEPVSEPEAASKLALESAEESKEKSEPVQVSEPVQIQEQIVKQESVSNIEPAQQLDSFSEPNENTDSQEVSPKKSKAGLIAAVLGIVAIAGYFAFSGKPSDEKIEETVVTKTTTVENNTTLDLSKPTKFKAGSIEFEMMPCPAGSFMMGSQQNELGREEQETPHNVTIEKPFLIGKYEVVQALFSEVTGENYSKYYGLDNPADSVSYNAAEDFCKKLNEMTKLVRPAGYKFDIPTEAQWEYACRAGSTTAINSGKDLTSDKEYCANLDEVGWYVFNAFGVTHPVGQKNPNAWGIYDMHGNVGEWCKDWYIEGYGMNDKDTSDNQTKVVRGGNFVVVPSRCRCASRNMAPEDLENISLGFRIVLVSEK